MPVFVTDGDQRSALAVTRSLGRRGIDVVVGESRQGSLASSSKYCKMEFIYPSPIEDPRLFQKKIIEHLKGNSYDVIIPMTDVTCYLINEIRERLEDNIKIALPRAEVFEKASQKAELMRLASSLNVPIPKTYYIEKMEELEGLENKLEFPVVLKPVCSRVHTAQGWINGTVEYADSIEDLKRKYRDLHSKIPNPIIQERIDGPGHGVFLLYSNRELKAFFGHRRIREKPPSGGVSVVRESRRPDEKTLYNSCKLLEALNWDGVAMVEFKIDKRDNTPKLMEINGRLWGSLQLAIDAGVDFPYLIYQAALGKNPKKVEKFEEGIKTRWLLGDLDHLLIILLRRRRLLCLPRDYPGKFKTLAQFLKSFFEARTYQEIWKRDDPGPAINEIRSWINAGIKSLKKRWL